MKKNSKVVSIQNNASGVDNDGDNGTGSRYSSEDDYSDIGNQAEVEAVIMHFHACSIPTPDPISPDIIPSVDNLILVSLNVR